MLSFLLSLSLAQINSVPPPSTEIIEKQEVRPLPGRLDSIPVFNSNSPELILEEGILLSTFPKKGKKHKNAHLNFPFQGRFDIFAHHVAKAATPEDLRSLYLGVIVHNPGESPVKVNILHAGTYLSQPDAPFIDLPDQRNNLFGTVYAGPGSRVTNDILRNHRQSIFPPQLIIPAGESRMLLNLPIPVKELDPPINGRSTLMRLRTDGTIYVASLAMFAPKNEDESERSPTLAEWQNLLKNGELSSPRDKAPTLPENTKKPIIYGRVAGVSQGSEWKASLTDNPQVKYLTIPDPGQVLSYGISTLHRGTLGTKQIQSAPMLRRYPDTAYYAHGNYGVHYNLHLPLHNKTEKPQTVLLSVQTPIKEDTLSQKGLRFLKTPRKRVFFRGTVRVRYNDRQGISRTKYVHLVQNRGEKARKLVRVNLKPNSKEFVKVDFLYPPDATPPQVLTIETMKSVHPIE
ncbi:MAG: DUF3370 domain-containing protein [Cyanobacteria bacterium P01_A01_bin.84]